MQPVTFNSELIIIVMGSVISLLFKFFPVLNTWYAARRTEAKSGIMIGLMVLTAGVITFLAKNNIIPVEQPITLQSFVLALFYAVSSNQFTYLIFPDPKSVKAAKKARLE